MCLIHKCYVGVVSGLKVLFTKIHTAGKVKVTYINSIRGAFRVEVIGNGTINIGRFLMSRGPLYLKCVNYGAMEIGEKVFLTTIVLLRAQRK